MGNAEESKPPKRPKKVRVEFRRNRTTRKRQRDWTREALEAEDHEVDTNASETVRAKGSLSRKRTVLDHGEQSLEARGLRCGVVIAMRGLYADVDDGTKVWPCTVRRVLRTRLIEERHPVTVGDRVHFRPSAESTGVVQEGVIEDREPRTGILQRQSGRRLQTIVANVDYVVVVSSAGEPYPKPHLIDRYIVAAHAGEITPVVCMNKMDLDENGSAAALLERYAALDYRTLFTSTVTGVGLDELRTLLAGRASVLSGQSGVGKSSLLNAIQPGLQLRVGQVADQTQKGRHTTVTARLIPLEVGGYVVDTPGVRSFDMTAVDPGQVEAYFREFVPLVPDCKYPDCTHIHENGCAIKNGVESGAVHPDRYASYVRILEDPASPS
jgi:ribosome biogenesis GTPase